MILAFTIHAALWATDKIMDTGKMILKISHATPMAAAHGHLKWSRGGNFIPEHPLF